MLPRIGYWVDMAVSAEECLMNSAFKFYNLAQCQAVELASIGYCSPKPDTVIPHGTSALMLLAGWYLFSIQPPPHYANDPENTR
jgi:hypothetical protein